MIIDRHFSIFMLGHLEQTRWTKCKTRCWNAWFIKYWCGWCFKRKRVCLLLLTWNKINISFRIKVKISVGIAYLWRRKWTFDRIIRIKFVNGFTTFRSPWHRFENSSHWFLTNNRFEFELLMTLILNLRDTEKGFLFLNWFDEHRFKSSWN